MSFNLIEFVDALPGNVKQQVLFSLVGSVNASLIGTAQSIIRRLTADGHDMQDVGPYEVEQLLLGPDLQNGTEYARNVNAIGQRWRDQLVSLTDKEDAGSLAGTIDFMVSSPRKVDEKLLSATLKAAGLVTYTSADKQEEIAEVLDKHLPYWVRRNASLPRILVENGWTMEQALAAARRALAQDSASPAFVMVELNKEGETALAAVLCKQPDDSLTSVIAVKQGQLAQARSERLAQQRGAIEWLIDQALAPDGDPDFNALSDEQQLALTEKLASALERTRDSAVIGVLNRDRRWTFGDLPIIAAAINEVKQHC
jgi:hypothetical protein